MQSLRYFLAALALGAIADWGSETFFWSAPPSPVTLAERVLTMLAYAGAAGTALSAVILVGASGLAALFLGGAILGFLVEGAVVGTMYDAFPFQVVWTPLAWHALITGVLVLGFGRMAGYLPPLRMAFGWLLVGIIGGIWAQFWPLERGAPMPGLNHTLAYMAGLGLIVPLANILLDRIATLPRPPPLVLFALPGLACAIWLSRFVATPSAVLLACPTMIALSVFAMHKPALGRPTNFGKPPSSPMVHGLFLIAPITASLMAVLGWRIFDGLAVNVPFAAATGLISCILWLYFLVQSFRSAIS